MASCSICGTTILFGGIKEEDQRYCGEDCQANHVLANMSDRIPEAIVQETMRKVREDACPRCGGNGPVDVFTSHKVTSFIVMTSWKNQPQLSCRGCATKSQLAGTLHSTILGWWGFPWGLIMTPVQIGRNLMALARTPDPAKTAGMFEGMVRAQLAAETLEQEHQAA